MKKYIKLFFDNEILSYLFFGVAAMLVYMGTRFPIYYLTNHVVLSTALGNVTAILFAFFTNDTIVFKQERSGWTGRLLKFSTARISTLLMDLALSFLLVDRFPMIIGQFVGGNLKTVNTIETVLAQFLVILFNYIFSKLFIFKNKEKERDKNR